MTGKMWLLDGVKFSLNVIKRNAYLVLAGVLALGEPHNRLLSGDGHHEVGPALAAVPLTNSHIRHEIESARNDEARSTETG